VLNEDRDGMLVALAGRGLQPCPHVHARKIENAKLKDNQNATNMPPLQG